MAKKPSAEWIGEIVVGNLVIQGKLFSATTRRPEIRLVDVHAVCSKALEEIPTQKEKTLTKPPVTKTEKQLFCAACQKTVPPEEAGKGLTVEGELVLVTESELDLLKPIESKRLIATCIKADDPLLEAIGTGRRLYFFPKPDSVRAYYLLWLTLKKHGLYGLIEELAIGKENISYPAIIRPITLPRELTTGEKGLLVVEALREPGEIKDPGEILDFPYPNSFSYTEKDLPELAYAPLSVDSFKDPRYKRLLRLKTKP